MIFLISDTAMHATVPDEEDPCMPALQGEAFAKATHIVAMRECCRATGQPQRGSQQHELPAPLLKA